MASEGDSKSVKIPYSMAIDLLESKIKDMRERIGEILKTWNQKDAEEFQRLTREGKIPEAEMDAIKISNIIESLHEFETIYAKNILTENSDVTTSIEIKGNNSIDNELMEKYPRKYLLLQNQEVVLVEENLDDIWSKLDDYSDNIADDTLQIISPVVKSKTKRKLGWRIQRRR